MNQYNARKRLHAISHLLGSHTDVKAYRWKSTACTARIYMLHVRYISVLVEGGKR